MRVIALHSPKGGVGRTLTCVALTRAFQQHSLRIHVVDASDHADCEVMSLRRWSHRVGQLDPDGMHPLRVTIAPDTGTVSDVLGQKAECEGDYQDDVILIDTAKYLDERGRIALQAADLVLAPFRNKVDATWIARILSSNVPQSASVRSLFCGFTAYVPEDRSDARTIMRDYPPLEREFPSDLDLFRTLWAGEVPPSDPDLADGTDKWKNWPFIEALASEVMGLHTARTM